MLRRYPQINGASMERSVVRRCCKFPRAWDGAKPRAITPSSNAAPLAQTASRVSHQTRFAPCQRYADGYACQGARSHRQKQPAKPTSHLQSRSPARSGGGRYSAHYRQACVDIKRRPDRTGARTIASARTHQRVPQRDCRMCSPRWVQVWVHRDEATRTQTTKSIGSHHHGTGLVMRCHVSEGTSRAYCFNTFHSDSWISRPARAMAEPGIGAPDTHTNPNQNPKRRGGGGNPALFPYLHLPIQFRAGFFQIWSPSGC